MKQNNIDTKKVFIVFVAALFLLIGSFSIYTLITAVFSYSELEEKWDGVTVATSFSGGNGSAENPYVIKDASEFVYFQSLIEGESYEAYQDKYYILGNDIDFNGHTLTPIGARYGGKRIFNVEDHDDDNFLDVVDNDTSDVVDDNTSDDVDDNQADEDEPLDDKEDEERFFKGHFNGDGFSLSHFVIKQPDVIDDVSYYSLFSKTVDAEIVHLNMEDVTICPEENEIIKDDEEDEKIVVSLLVGHSSSTEEHKALFADFSVSNLKLDIHNVTSEGTIFRPFIGTISDEIEIQKVFIAGEMIGNVFENDISFIPSEYKTSVSYVIDGIKLTDIRKENLYMEGISYYYSLIGGEFYINGDIVPLDSVLEVFNENTVADYYWEFKDDKISIHKFKPVQLKEIPALSQAFSFSIRRSGAIPLHNTGVEGTNVYVNDLTSDYNYYMGLNYVTSPNETLPTRENKGLYGASNLAKVYIHYSSADYSDDTVFGRVSVADNYTDFYYYKYYPIVDGKVTFDLIDNPWANRPSGKSFNGWITDYEGAEISIDMGHYVRSVTIPIVDGNTDISIDFYSAWKEETLVTGTNFNGLDSPGMVMYEPTYEYDYGDVSSYYIKRTQAAFTNYPTGAVIYTMAGVRIGATRCTTYPGGCDYLIQSNSAIAEPGAEYYILTFSDPPGPNAISVTQVQPTLTMFSPFNAGDLVAGNFEKVTKTRNSSIEGLYNFNGVMQHGNCNANTCELYQMVQFYNEYGNINEVDLNKIYYYLVTRDTNIMVLTGNVNGFNVTKPVTITSINNGVNGNHTITVNSSNNAMRLDADARIEYVNLNSSASASSSLYSSTGSRASNSIIGNYHNLKIGRGVMTTNTNRRINVFGGTSMSNTVSLGNSQTGTTYPFSLIIESGRINSIYFTESRSGKGTLVLDAFCVMGSDLDRVKGVDTNLDVYYSFQGNAGNNVLRTSTDHGRVYDLYVKSGRYGTSKADIFTGIYVGGRGASVFGTRALTIEGGYIYSVIGGLGSTEEQKNYNVIYIYMKGGSADAVFGGSGSGETYGNRIVSVTGGTVNYSVFGGSNGSTVGTTGDSGILNGDSYVYVGGSAHIGGGSGQLFRADAGNVFGAGAGNTNQDGLGSVNNSNIVINGDAIIEKSVYGGGNYGSVGAKSTSSVSTTNVLVLGGTIKESVYGGGNNNGSGTSTRVTATLNIDIQGGSISQSVYGGSRTTGVIYGGTNVTISGGTIAGDVYGGGEGGYTNNNSPGTYVRDSVNVTINNGTISGSVYGGSAYGIVNAANRNTNTSNATTTVTINGGTVTNNVFGGAKGSNSYTPKVVGNITVNMNNGSVGNVFGGFDASGKPGSGDIVYLNGGTVGNAYGGGNNADQTTSDIRLQGTTINGNLYGGSNETGTVTNSYVTVTSGSVSDIFGGNNLAGTTVNTHVTITNGTITGDVYGGGNQANSTNTSVSINGGDLNDVYGGGLSAGVSNSTHVTFNSGSADNVFGGSNTLGAVNDTVVNVNNTSGSGIVAVYGGNNLGGTTDTSTVTISDGTIVEVYGGGKKVGINSTIVNANGGEIDSVYGGSNIEGDVTTSHVNVGNVVGSTVTIGDVYGGNNAGGVTTDTNVHVYSGTITNVFGGGENADVGATNVIVDGGIITDVYGGGNAAGVGNDTSLDINGGTITNNVYGGGNEGIVQGNTNVTITNAAVQGNAFAGGNGSTAVVYLNSVITIDGTTEIGTSSSEAPNDGCVFGSGNAASTGLESTNNSKAIVYIAGGIIHGNVYGGPKMAVVYGTTEANVGLSAVTSSVAKLQAEDDANQEVELFVPDVNPASLTEGNIVISGTVFGGGESNASGSTTYDWNFVSVTKGITVTVDGTGYENHSHNFVINGSIFGSGNASTSSGTSLIYIKNLGTTAHPNKGISIQRANYLEIDHTVIELSGATDRTNQFGNILYSFNIIDKMVIKNDTTLLLQHNANLLQELYSGVDSGNTLVPATVDIDDDTKTVTKNVDNRIYMIPGQNLNVTINQAATAYGKVTGMTFFGMYNSYEGGTYRFGLYDDDVSYGDTGNASMAIVGGSYVIGLRNDNHDITKDGFYSNYLDEETYTDIYTAYIDPTPIGKTGYRWVIGFEAISYEFTLQASRYSSLGTYELQLIDFAEGDTSFTVLGFDSNGLNPELSLVDSNLVPRVGASEEEANSIFGLSLKVETQEWTGYGTTKLLSNGGGQTTGDQEYRTDSRQLPPSMMFYLYHAKNITCSGNLGTVVLTMQGAVPKNEIDYEIKFITVTIHLTAINVDADSYDASITYDKKYELPSSTDVNITNQSQFSAYYSLTTFKDDFSKVYGNNNDNVHVLVTNYPLPVNTMITMLDYGTNPNRPEYYYFRINQSVYNDSITQLNQYNEITYRLSQFIKMDSTSTNNTYNDASANLSYYDNTSHLVDEEFMFIFDFKECTQVTGDHLGNTMLFELRNPEDRTIFNVLGIRESIMVYNTYESSNVVLNQTIADTDSYLYYNVADQFSYSTEVLYNETENRQPVIDTNYESSKMGLNVVFIDKDGEKVSSSLLIGTSIHIGTQEYFADGDGVFRIKLANKVSNLNRAASITVNKDLPSGQYTVQYYLFASDDGLHNSYVENSVMEEFTVNVVSADNAIIVDCEDPMKVVDGTTGLNMDNTNINTYTVKYYSHLSNPNFRIEVFKRDVSTIDSTTFTSVPFSQLFTNNLTVVRGNEVSFSMGGDDEKDFNFELQRNLTSGTYRIVFRLYDSDQLIDEETKYVIVKKKTS